MLYIHEVSDKDFILKTSSPFLCLPQQSQWIVCMVCCLVFIMWRDEDYVSYHVLHS